MRKPYRGAAAILIATFALGLLVRSERDAAAGPPTVGRAAPNFSLVDLDGTEISLKRTIAAHRVTLVNFWATWCPPCQGEIPELISFHQKYKPRGVALLAVDLGESPAKVRGFIESRGISFPVLLDQQGKAGDLYGIRFIPTTLVIDDRGVIRARFDGGVTQEALKAKVDPLLR